MNAKYLKIGIIFRYLDMHNNGILFSLFFIIMVFYKMSPYLLEMRTEIFRDELI